MNIKTIEWKSPWIDGQWSILQPYLKQEFNKFQRCFWNYRLIQQKKEYHKTHPPFYRIVIVLEFI